MDRYAAIIDRLTRWARAEAGVQSALVVGSQARADHPADPYSDLDLVLVVDQPEAYLSDDAWLEGLGRLRIVFNERTVDGCWERRALFEGALDVDIVLRDTASARAMLDGPRPGILGRGYRVLLDKTGLCARLAQLPPPAPEPAMDRAAFTNLVSDFWYHSVWAAKKLLRGELWSAKFCVDSYLKGLLLAVLEAHARAEGRDCWHAGRFLDQWAPAWATQGLPDAFGPYELSGLGGALLATMALFSRAARSLARERGWTYPEAVQAYAQDWVQAALPAGGGPAR